MTLLEVMTALLVFGTGVLVIMLTMTKNIARVQEIKLKTTATMLAKE
jgi:Tfp pilus assembly protein PilV